jgi:hypothetical protein
MNIMEQAIKDLFKADKAIKKEYRYFCGIESDAQSQDLKCEKASFFFLSPDGQNGELLSELQNMGYKVSMFNAEYYWRVSKSDVSIEYIEGDIYIKLIN